MKETLPPGTSQAGEFPPRTNLDHDAAPAETCRFRSSFGGDLHCSDPIYHYGFCRFHFECYLRGEILANCQINEKLTDQVRRRAINFHGLRLPQDVYVGSSSERRSRKP